MEKEKLMKEIKLKILENWKNALVFSQENEKEAAIRTKAFADGMYYVYRKLIHLKI